MTLRVVVLYQLLQVRAPMIDLHVGEILLLALRRVRALYIIVVLRLLMLHDFNLVIASAYVVLLEAPIHLAPLLILKILVASLSLPSV